LKPVSLKQICLHMTHLAVAKQSII